MFDDTLISIHAPTRGATILCNHRGLVFGFQSTLPREERLSFPCNISFHLIFQSTLPREERQTMRKLTIAELNFNPRSHERSDPMVKKFLLMKMISIHAPTRGATCNSIRPLCIYEFQSTLPREERHGTSRINAYQILISIHAPTRGATGAGIRYLADFRDFNPRSHERSDVLLSAKKQALRNFNPRSHERSDQARRSTSLHRLHFNPRSHERSDGQE